MIIKSLHHSGHLAPLMATELSIPAEHSEMLPPIIKVMRGQLEETSLMVIGVSET